MSAATQKRRLPWGALLGLIALGVLYVGSFSGLVPPAAAATFVDTALGLAVCTTLFLIVHALSGPWWAVLAGVALLFHPGFQPLMLSGNDLVRGQGCMVLGYGLGVAAMPLVFSRRPRVLAGWLGAVGACFLVATAWRIDRGNAVLAASVFALGVAGCALVATLTRRSMAQRPSWANMLSAWILAFAAPVAGLCLGALWVGGGQTLQWNNMVEEWRSALSSRHEPLTWDRINSWTWPSAAVVGPVLFLAGWRAIRRGRLQVKKCDRPTPWAILIATIGLVALTCIYPPASEHLVPLPILFATVLAAVFLAADLLQGIADRLVLRPPATEGGGE